MRENLAVSEMLDALAEAVAAGSFVQLTLSKPTATAGDVKSIDIRPILVKRVLKLSFTYHHRTRDVVKNFTPAEVPEMLRMQLAEHFRAARLMTTQGDVQLVDMGGNYQLKRHAATQTEPAALTHDRAKQRRIETAGKAYLHALAITDAKGVVYKNAQDKFRQIDKYIEVLDGLLRALPKKECLRVVDMGAGKGYLTFALYDYVTSVLGREVTMVGVEFRADLVEKCNAIAKAAGFKGLQFVEGSIADYDCAGADVVIALHACDTATDDAIAKAVRAGAALIVVAPCCHKQIRRAMGGDADGLQLVMKYGTYVERMAEMLTDGMRAQLLEMHGYRAKLFEFISGEHTPKNVMIVAEKLAQAPKEREVAAMRESLAQTKAMFGIAHHQLERLLAVK